MYVIDVSEVSEEFLGDDEPRQMNVFDDWIDWGGSDWLLVLALGIRFEYFGYCEGLKEFARVHSERHIDSFEEFKLVVF